MQNALKNIAAVFVLLLLLAGLLFAGAVTVNILQTAWMESVAPEHGWFWAVATLFLIMWGGGLGGLYLSFWSQTTGNDNG